MIPRIGPGSRRGAKRDDDWRFDKKKPGQDRGWVGSLYALPGLGGMRFGGSEHRRFSVGFWFRACLRARGPTLRGQCTTACAWRQPWTGECLSEFGSPSALIRPMHPGPLNFTTRAVNPPIEILLGSQLFSRPEFIVANGFQQPGNRAVVNPFVARVAVIVWRPRFKRCSAALACTHGFRFLSVRSRRRL